MLQLRRHPHKPLTRSNQLSLECADQMPAIVQRPQPLAAEIRGPRDEIAPPRQRPSARPTSAPPRRRQPPSTTACARPLQSRSCKSPPQPLGATGERTDLNRGSSHAPIRSRSTVSGSGGDTTLASQPFGATCGNRVSRRRPRVCGAHRTPPPTEDDSEFRNVTSTAQAAGWPSS